jgi:hypothetical protein
LVFQAFDDPVRRVQRASAVGRGDAPAGAALGAVVRHPVELGRVTLDNSHSINLSLHVEESDQHHQMAMKKISQPSAIMA